MALATAVCSEKREAEKERTWKKTPTTTKIPHTNVSDWHHIPTTTQNKTTAKACSFFPMPENHLIYTRMLTE